MQGTNAFAHAWTLTWAVRRPVLIAWVVAMVAVFALGAAFKGSSATRSGSGRPVGRLPSNCSPTPAAIRPRFRLGATIV
ncbi:MAG: hypothetical protein U0R65_02195 [Candidatus Nanopelagicales bacterium]